MKQSSMVDYIRSPLNQLQGYNIRSGGWLSKSQVNTSPLSIEIKKDSSSKLKKKTRTGTRKLSQKEPSSPLDKWMNKSQLKKLDELQLKVDTDNKPFTRSHSFEKYGNVFPNPDDILKKIDTLEKEKKMLDDYDLSRRLSKSQVNTSPVSIKIKKDSSFKSKRKTRTGTCKVSQKEPSSPLDKWINTSGLGQRKKLDTKKTVKKPFTRSHSFEKYGIVFPNPDDILKNIDTLEKEGKMLDDYDLISNVSISDSFRSLSESTDDSVLSLPLLDCEHLPQSELKKYFSKYSDYLKDISNEVTFSQRHQTYKKQSSRSGLTYSFSTLVFTQSQLEYLMKNIEESLDPKCEKTEYSFKVWLPELCLRIFMDLFDMNENEAVDYLNKRPIE